MKEDITFSHITQILCEDIHMKLIALEVLVKTMKECHKDSEELTTFNTSSDLQILSQRARDISKEFDRTQD